MKEKYFLKDIALSESKKDAFHHIDYVRNVKKIIEEHSPPFNIALIGKWGVGKSSIINLLKSEIDGNEEYKIHEINAWKYENESLRKAFLKNLWKTFNGEQDISVINRITSAIKQVFMEITPKDEPVRFKDAVKTIKPYLQLLTLLWAIACIVFLLTFILVDIGTTFLLEKNFKFELYKSIDYFKSKIWIPLAIPPFFALFMNFVNGAVQKKTTSIQMMKPIETPDEYEELFKKEIKRYKAENPEFRKLIVIIDDLDRLSPKKVVDALDAIKAFVDVEECIFIVSCDEDILKKALEKQRLTKTFEEVDGELFLDKLFQFRIPLPPIIESDMRDFARNIANEEVPDLVNMCNGKFNEIINILIHPEVTTPRQVKKLLNTFTNNLLIAKNREGRKLESELLTGKNGIKMLAKLSVLQSDYNDVYNGLIDNYKLLDDILEKDNGAEIPNEKIHKYFSKNKIKDEYEGLINFLLRTQHITTENFGPFLYLGQGAVGLLAGDEKERRIRKDLLSGNDRGIIRYLDSEKNSSTIALAIIEQLKNTPSEDLEFVLKAAYQLVNYIPDNLKREFSDTISYRILEIPIENSRLWQVEYNNLIDVYLNSQNKIGTKKALLYVANNILRHNDWKTFDNKEFKNKDYIKSSFEIVDYLLTKDNEINDNDIENLIRDFVANADNKYEYFPLEDLHELYTKHQNLFEKYFGFVLFNQLSEHIIEEPNDKSANEEFFTTIYSLIPTVKQMYQEEFFNLVPKLLGVKKEYTNMVIDIIKEDMDNISTEISSQILRQIIKLDYNEDDIITSLLKFLDKLDLSDFNFDEEILVSLDLFLYNILPSTDKEEELIEFNNITNKLVSKIESGFNSLTKLFTYLKENALKVSYYDNIFHSNIEFFSKEQRTDFFGEVNKGVSYPNTDENQFNRVYTLYAELVKFDDYKPIISSVLSSNIGYFSNNQFTQYPIWALNFIKILKITSHLIEESQLITLTNKLIQYGSQYPELLVKCFATIGENLPEEKIIESVNEIVEKATSDIAKLDALEYFRTIRKDYINSDNSNITPYAEFLVSNLDINPEQFINDLYWFSKIATARFIIFINKMMNMPKQQREIIINLCERTSHRLFKGYETEQQIETLSKIIEDTNVEVLNQILVGGIPNKSEIFGGLVSHIREKNSKYTINLLELVGYNKEYLSIKQISEFYAETFSVIDQENIATVETITNKYFSDFRFNHSKSDVYNQLLRLFKRVNNQTKVNILQIAKNFGMDRDFKNARKSDELTLEEKKIVKDVYQLRK